MKSHRLRASRALLANSLMLALGTPCTLAAAEPDPNPQALEHKPSPEAQAAISVFERMSELAGVPLPKPGDPPIAPTTLITATSDPDETLFTLALYPSPELSGPGKPLGALRPVRVYPCPITAASNRSLLDAATNAKILQYRDAMLVAKFETARGDTGLYIVAGVAEARTDPKDQETQLVFPQSSHADLAEAQAAAAKLAVRSEAERTQAWIDAFGRAAPNIPPAPEKGFVDAWKDVPSVPAPPPEFCRQPVLDTPPPPPAPAAPPPHG